VSVFSRLDQAVLPAVGNALARLGRGAARMRVFTIGAGVLAAAITFVAVYAATRAPVAGDPTIGDVVRVGVSDGDSVPAYLASTQQQLAALPDGTEVYALVSFSAYLAPDRLPAALSSVSVSSVFARVPLAGVQTELIRLGAYKLPDDVVAGMDAAAMRKDDEAADYRRTLQKVPDGGAGTNSDDIRRVYASDADVATAEATAYRRHCSCVYAAVVRAAPAALRALAQRSEVRAVDPASEVKRLDRTVFLPPLPEQTDRVRPVGN
jgi:hypothetical protein